MEEKIFIPQNNLSFDIQRFAETPLDAGTYTLENVNGHKVICYFTNITDIGAAATSTSLVSISSTTKTATVTIGGKTFKLANATADGAINFYGTSSAVTKIEIENVAVTTDQVTYTPESTAEIAFSAGTGTIVGTGTINFSKANATKIDGITYSAKRGTQIDVTADTVTLVSGEIEVGTDTESLDGKNFVVDSAVTATFNLANTDSVTINDIVYKAKGTDCVVEIEEEEITLTGKFEITLAKGKSIELGGITFKADDESAVTFTYNNGEISGVEGELGVNSKSPKNTVTVDGVTYEGKGDLSFTDSLITVDGAFDIGDGDESLSGKKFAFNPDSDVTVNLAANDTGVKLNDATYTAGASSLTLDYVASAENITIDGEGATVTGTGNFYLETADSTVNINGIDFTNSDDAAELGFTATDTVKISSAFTVGDGSTSISNLTIAADSEIAGSTFNLGSNGTVNVEGVTYKGNGTVEIGETAADINLSGSSISVGSVTEDLSGKNFSFDSTCAATFAFDNSGSVKINGDTYSAADSTGGSVEIAKGGAVTVANSSVSFDTTSSATPKTLTISSGKDLTLNNVKYTAKNDDAQVTVDGTSIKIDSGTVAIDSTSDFSVKLAENATAQINDVNFKKTASTSNSTDDISVQEGAITLNSKFTVGNGTQKLDNLVVTLNTSDKSIFKLGTADSKVTIIQNSGVGNDTAETINGVTYAGSGTVTNAGTNSATISGEINVTNAPENFNLHLTSGTVTVNGSSVSGTGTVTVGADNSISVSGDGVTSVSTSGTVTVGSTTVNASGSSATLLLTSGAVSSISTSGTVTVGSQTFTASGGSVTLSVASGAVTSVSTTEENVSISITGGSQTYNGTLRSGHDLTPNGTTWSDSVEYTSYRFENGKLYGVYATGEDEITGTTDISVSGSNITLIGSKPLTYTGSGTVTTPNDIAYTVVNGKASFAGDSTPSVTSGYVTYNSTDNSFTDKDGKSYTASGTVVKKKTSSEETIYAATGTRNFSEGDSATKSYGELTYTVTGGTYTITITDNYETATAELTSGSATYNAPSTFTYNSTAYTVVDAVSFEITFDGENIAEGTKTGTATYDGQGQAVTLTGTNGGSYTLQSDAKMLHNFGGGGADADTFYSGTAQCTTATSYNNGTYTYTAIDGNLTLTCTRTPSSSDSFAFTSGKATRNADNETSDYTDSNNKTKSYSFTNVKKVLYGGSGQSEKLYSASGNSTDTTGEKVTINGTEYNLTSGTYSITVENDTTPATPTLTSATGTTTKTNEAFTISNDSNNYTASGTVTLNLTFDGTNSTETFTGTATYQENGGSQFTYGGKNYTSDSNGVTYQKINSNDTATVYAASGTSTDTTGEKVTINVTQYDLATGEYTITVANGQTDATPTFVSGTVSIPAGNTFTLDGVTYTASDAVTLNLSGANQNISGFTGTVTYTESAGTSFTYGGKTYTSDNNGVTYQKTNSNGTPSVYTATGTRSADGESYIVESSQRQYTLTNGTYETKVVNGDATDTGYKDKVISGNGTTTINSGTFTLGSVEYKVLNAATLKLTITDSEPLETFTAGTVTYQDDDASFEAGTPTKLYTTKSGTKVTHQLVRAAGSNDVVTTYAAEGTRPYATADAQTVTYPETNGNEYKVTAGTYNATVTTGTLTEALDTDTNRTAVFSTSSGAFWFNGNQYTATGYTTFTLTYDANGTPSMTAASGKGTRTAVAADSTITVTDSDGNTYKTQTDSTIQIDITGPSSSSTETFLYGTAKHTGNFKYGGKDYTAEGNTSITYTKTNATTTPTLTYAGAGTRTPTETKFTFDGKEYTNTNSDSTVTYCVTPKTGDTTKLEEVLYTAQGTRNADGINDKVTGAWGNEYTIPAGTGTVSIKVVNGKAEGANAPTVTEGTATKTIAATTGTFTYGANKDTYTANKEVTLTLNVTNDGTTKTETFTSGSAYDGTSKYIVKTGSQVKIGDVTYTATGSDIITVTVSGNDITAISDGTIEGEFAGGNTATIGGISYTASGASKLNVTDMNTVTATGGTFTATGNFTSAKTINGNALTVSSDTSVKVTFDSSGVTQIEDISGTASISGEAAETAMTVKTGTGSFTIGDTAYTISQGAATFTLNDSGKVTKIEATNGNGSFTIGTETFAIANDSVNGITFTVDPSTGKATKIEGLDRNATGDYVTVTTGGKTINLRRTSNTLERQADDSWAEPKIVNFYVVTYTGDATTPFTVQAVDNNGDTALVNIANTGGVDYTLSDENKTLTFKDKTKEVVVMNSTTTPVKVNDVDGINQTSGNSAIKIDTSGEFKLGTFSGTTFTENAALSGDDPFKIDSNGTFTVDNTGKITVSAKNAVDIVKISASKDANVHIATTGRFTVNDKVTLYIKNTTAGNDISLLFDDSGKVTGIQATGACTFRLTQLSGSSDLAESADAIYSRYSTGVKNSSGELVTVTILNNPVDVDVTTDNNGSICKISPIFEDATIIFTDALPNSLTINTDDTVTNLALNKEIKYNSTLSSWVCGDATAQTAETGQNLTYKIVVENDRVALYYSTNGSTYTQTKNKADYNAVGLTAKPDKDGGDLPTLSGNLTFTDDGKVTEIEITPSAASASYTVAGQTLTLTGKTTLKTTGSDTKTFDNGIEVELGTQPITYDGMNFTGNGGSSKAILTSANAVTLDNNAKVTNAKSTVTFTALNGGTLTFDNITVKDLAANTQISAVNPTTSTLSIKKSSGSEQPLTVTGDTNYTVSAGDNPYISGISNGAQVSGAFAQNASVVTDSNGTFKFGSTSTPQQFDIAGDDNVTLSTGNAVTAIGGLSATGSITGNFTNAITVNTKSVNVTGDATIGVVGGSGTISKIYNVANGANVVNAGGASTISTEGNGGTYTLGKKYSISAGTADFISTVTSGAPAISAIKNIDGSATVGVYQDETGLAVENDSVKISGSNYSTTPLKLAMGGDTISTVDGLVTGGGIEGLSAGALVKVGANNSVKINDSSANFQANNAATVYAAAGGYDSVTGFTAGTQFTTVKDGAILIPTVEGSYLFGSTPTTYTFSAKPILKTGTNKLASIGGLANGQTVVLDHVESASGFYIGANEIKLDKASDSTANVGTGDAAVTFTMGDNNTVKSVTNLKDAVTGLSAGASVQVTGGEVKINDKTLKVTGDTDYTVISGDGASSGYSTVTGVGDNTTFNNVGDSRAIIIPTAAGTYKFGATGSTKEYKFDAIPTLKADGTALKEISIGGGQSVKLSAEQSTALKVGNDSITLTKDSSEQEVEVAAKLIMGTSGNVDKVQELKGKISGLKADALVEMTVASGDVTVNSASAQLAFTGNTGTLTAHVTDGGYDYVTGLKTGVNVTAAKNVSLVTDGVGKFTFPDATTGQPAHTFEITGDNEVTLNTGNSSQVTAISGVTDALIKFGNAENLKINSKDVTVAAGDVLQIDGNGVISGITGTAAGGTYNLPGNVTVAVNPTNPGVKVNNKGLKMSQTPVTVHTSQDTVTTQGYDWVAGLKTGAEVTIVDSGNVEFVTAEVGTFKFGNQTVETDDAQITLKTSTGAVISEIYGIDAGKSVTLYADQTGLKVNGKAITFSGITAGNELKLNIGNNDTIESVENLRGDISGLEEGTLVQVKKANTNIKINSSNVNLYTTDSDITVHATADGYDYITGFNKNSSVKTAANVSIVTAENGVFKSVGQTLDTDDAQITLKTDGSSKITEIGGLDASKYVNLYAAQNNLIVNGKTISFAGSYSSNHLKLTVGNNGTIESVENLNGNKITGLSAGALVQVKNASNDITFNSDSANLNTSDADITVHATASGFDYIKGFSDGKTVTTAKNASIVTDGAGTFTFGSNKFKTDAQITLKTDSDSKVTTIGGLGAGQSVIFYQEETSGIYVGNDKIALTKIDDTNNIGADSNGVKLIMNGNGNVATVQNLQDKITGLTAGAMVQVTTASGDVKINDDSAQLTFSGNTGGTLTAHVKDNTGFDYVTGLKTGINVTAAKNVSLVTDGTGTYTFGSSPNAHKFYTDDAQITLKTDSDSKVTAVGGLDAGKKLALYQTESGLSVNGHLVNVTGATTMQGEQVTLTMGNSDTISQVENLRGNINGLNEGALIKVTDAATDRKINSDTANLQIRGDTDITVRATADGYDSITGLTGGANTSNAPIVTTAKDNATLITDATGAFKFQVGATPSDKVFTTDGDTNVAFVIGTSSVLDGIYNLDGTVKGDFTDVLKVEGKEILITSDTEVSVVAAEGKVTKLAGLTDANTSDTTATIVKKSGGAATISTDGTGLFQFAETNAHKFSISAGTADFMAVGDVPTITGIKSLNDNAPVDVVIYQNETDFAVENNTLKLTGVNTTDTIKLTMDGDTIKTVDNLKGEVSGLSVGATVNVATNSKVTVNGVALKIDEGDTNAYKVIAAENGYTAIKEVQAESNNVSIVEAPNASINVVTSEADQTNKVAKTYTIGDGITKNYIITGDSDVTLTTDANTNVTAINGLNGTLQSSENNSTIRVNNVDVYSSSADVSIVANNTADQGISSVAGLTNNNMVNVPAGVAVQVSLKTGAGEGVNTLLNFTINGTAYNLIGESDTISVKDKTIKGLNANARLTISGAEGNYKVNGKELTLSEGHNVVVGEANGAHLYEPGAIDFASFTPTDEIIERVFGEQVAATITPVDNTATTSESPGAVIVKEGNNTATLNKNNQLAVVKAAGTVNIRGTDDSVVASAGVEVNLQTDNKNARLMQTAGTMTVKGYDYTTGAGIQLTNSDVISAVRDSLKFSGEDITLSKDGPQITIKDSSGVVNFHDLNGKKQIVAYAVNSGDTVNAFQSKSDSVVLVGNWNGIKNAKLYGGNGNDTAFGGAGDYFNLGAGQNYIELKDGHASGATIELESSYGSTTVKGFDNSSANDTVKVDVTNTDAHYTDEGLVFTKGNASLTVTDITSVEESGGISYVNVMINHSGDTEDAVKTAVARDGMAIKVKDDGATAYVGNNSGIDLTEFNKGDINLDTGKGSFIFTNGGATDVTFRGITSIKGGSGDHELTGASDVSNTLEAGTGACKIWGKGAAGDLLIANSSTDKTKASTFIFASGDGADTISNIQFYDTADTPNRDNDKMDVVSIEGGALTGVTTANNHVVFQFGNNDSLTVKDAVDSVFSFNDGSNKYYARVGKNEVTFSKFNETGGMYYYGANDNATLKISSDVSSTEPINLGGSSGNYTIGGGINILDASEATNALNLVGNSSNNTIKASKGGSTLYGGGYASDDLLIAGNNVDYFHYQDNQGNDTIKGASSGDVIEFLGRRIASASSITICEYESNQKLILGLGTTSSLTIVESAIESLTFKFSNGTKTWNDFKSLAKKKSGVSADLAEDYWENEVYANEFLDGDADFADVGTENIFGGDVKDIAHSNGELWTGNAQYSLAGGEQAYNFSELVDKHNK